MPKRFTETLVDYIDGQIAQENLGTILGGKLVLGGGSGVSGGSGQPWRGTIGQLIQSKVAYDTTEAATHTTASGNPSLVDNLNHIRKDIEDLQAAASSLSVQTVSFAQTRENTTELYSLDVPKNKVFYAAHNLRVADVWVELHANSHAKVQLMNQGKKLTGKIKCDGLRGKVIRNNYIFPGNTLVEAGDRLRASILGDIQARVYILTVRLE